MYKQRNHSQLLTDSSPEPVAMWPTKVGVWKSAKGYYWFSKSQWAQWRDYTYHLLTRAPNTKHYDVPKAVFHGKLKNIYGVSVNEETGLRPIDF